MNSDVVESWLRENGAKMASIDDDVDGVFEPCDALSKQMLECTTSDLAIEDVIYSLDKAVVSQTQAHVAAMAARASQYVT
ncbi:hypothetical protein Droror1_Dr00019883 [Drosera rotundifolia]